MGKYDDRPSNYELEIMLYLKAGKPLVSDVNLPAMLADMEAKGYITSVAAPMLTEKGKQAIA